ncbi:precorrin-3 methyltransferase [Archaeoglobus sulfaticallidus PM70-1]|uniref:Precorrin-3 methyltransferase n=1 Tax=Archaeoglobus sulfaticallidus PM70-1 TaxID=387631 RepID=N0BC64_9EURY|nr:precorrin-3B C(17)-methyltransferase [Archaeoglobus sulfaticallidus]AGK60573.1 precorrin-3 methyltransferase [Archaeoglobus sulfaticallidus PM70-1]
MQSRGKLYVVGIGPGSTDLLTIKALNALKDSEYILGHKTYIKRIYDLVKDKKVIESGMGREVERVRMAVKLAEESRVSLISGGDPSIYGILPLVIEYVSRNNIDVDVEAIPGVTASCAASSLLGSAISGDHAVISLSDLLIPWKKIEKRLLHALKGDFVVVIYNPSSRRRKSNLIRAMEIIREHRGDAMIGIVKNAYREGEMVLFKRVSEIIQCPEVVDMSTILIVPNSETIIDDGRMISPRGYGNKYNF